MAKTSLESKSVRNKSEMNEDFVAQMSEWEWLICNSFKLFKQKHKKWEIIQLQLTIK